MDSEWKRKFAIERFYFDETFRKSQRACFQIRNLILIWKVR